MVDVDGDMYVWVVVRGGRGGEGLIVVWWVGRWWVGGWVGGCVGEWVGDGVVLWWWR